MIEPFMPSQPLRGRRRKTSLRAVMDAIFYLLQSGCQWALLPHDFPPKSTVHHYFKRFCRDGTWRRMHDALYCRMRRLEGREEQPSFAIIDSQSVKTGPDARHDIGYDAGKKTKGRKRHILVDTLGMLLKIEVHAEDVRKQWFGSSSPFGGLVTFGTNSRGPGALPDAVFRKEMDWAFERDLLVAMHAGQNRYSYSVVPMKEMGYLGPKTLIVHFVLAKPEDRAAMLATGASLSYSVHSELRLGGGGYQAQQLVHMANSGVNVSFSFDTNSLAPIDMFETMSTAWYMGVPFTGTDTEKLQPLDFAQVIKMATINGAKALGLDTITGSLTVGKRADIVLIRADDLNMVPYGFVEGMVARTARAANVDTVIADGRIMKRGGKLVGLDVETIKGEAVRSAYDLRRRAGGKIAVALDVIPKF